MCVGRPWNSGVGDPWYYPKVLHGCKRPTVLSKMVLHGVRDPRYYPKSSVWVLETRGVIRKVLLPKRKHTVMFIT